MSLDEIKEAAARDPNYQKIKELLLNGVAVKNLPPGPAKEYLGVWNTLSVEQDLVIMDARRIVVPQECRARLLSLMHVSHPGLEKAKEKARQLYYWPRIADDLKATIGGCVECIKHLPSQQKEPLIQRTAMRPMEAIGLDLYALGGKNFLLIVDRYSGFIKVAPISSQSCAAVINVLDQWCAHEVGYPELVETDGGPCFRGPFQKWCTSHGTTPTSSSPHRAQGNGLAEAGVKNAKRLLDKYHNNFPEFAYALGEFNRDPRADGYSPASMFLLREPKGTLPSIRTPEILDIQGGEEARRAAQEKNKKHFDKAAKPLPPLAEGDPVVVQNVKSGKWDEFGRISEPHEDGRSYDIKMDDDRIIWRNRSFIRPDPRSQTVRNVEEELPPQPEVLREQDFPTLQEAAEADRLRRSERIKAKAARNPQSI